jgi:outer membrane protein OmpA-like peptidoglycan-associated protein
MQGKERLVAVVALLAWCAAAAQAQPSGRTADMIFKVEDLVFKVENLDARVQHLQVRETATKTFVELPADILFDFDSVNVRAAAEPALKQTASLIRKGALGMTIITGHTDAKGSPTYNQNLSEQRAAAVQSWLVEREGLSSERFQVKGFGATRPVAPNTRPDGSDDPEGRQRNRRVEIAFDRR